MSQGVEASEPSPQVEVKVHFTDYFAVRPEVLYDYGAFNVSLINDLPLFVDPFLLFNSTKAEYRALHEDVIRYVRFLRDKSARGELTNGLLRGWFTFPEVKQTWLGFSRVGNSGAGLGMNFARTLNAVRAALLRERAIQTLKAIGIESPARLVDSALGAGRENAKTDGAGGAVLFPVVEP
jgi:hypothetical protein